MSDWTIYHNPRCSKSRETLKILEEAGVKPKVVEYLKEPLGEKDLLTLAEKLGPEALVRVKEEKYRELKFPLNGAALVARELARNPELLERPIVVRGEKAVVARPPEKVKELF